MVFVTVVVTPCAVPLLKFESAVQVLPHVSGYRGPPAFTRHTAEITAVGVVVIVAVRTGVGDDVAASQAKANTAVKIIALTLFMRITGTPA